MFIKSGDLLSEYQKLTRDSSTANQTRGKSNIQNYYNKILVASKNAVVERTKYGNLTADQESYYFPPDLTKLSYVRTKLDDQWRPVNESPSMQFWYDLKTQNATSSRPKWYQVFWEQGRKYVELYPKPNTSVTNGLELTYVGQQDPLYFPDDYSAGTVDVTNGSITISGTGTTFTEDMVGRFIKISNGKYWYEIATFVDANTIQVTNNYQEDTETGASYEIAELARIPDEFDYSPVYGAAYQFFLPNNDKKSAVYKTLWEQDVDTITKRYREKTTGAVMQGIQVGYHYHRTPRNYPNRAIG